MGDVWDGRRRKMSRVSNSAWKELIKASISTNDCIDGYFNSLLCLACGPYCPDCICHDYALEHDLDRYATHRTGRCVPDEFYCRDISLSLGRTFDDFLWEDAVWKQIMKTLLNWLDGVDGGQEDFVKSVMVQKAKLDSER
jgi:hypothetical protein